MAIKRRGQVLRNLVDKNCTCNWKRVHGCNVVNGWIRSLGDWDWKLLVLQMETGLEDGSASATDVVGGKGPEYPRLNCFSMFRPLTNFTTSSINVYNETIDASVAFQPLRL